jgi:putative DNA primase/helicase
MIEITVGAGRRRPWGRRVAVENVAALIDLLARAPARVESWIVGALFEGDRRHGDRWQAQTLIQVDVDHGVGGEHTEHTSASRNAIQFAIDTKMLPGNFSYLTPRGVRIGFVLAEPELDRQRAEQAHRGAIALVARALPVKALQVDTGASSDVCRLMFLPNAIVENVARHALVEPLRGEPYTIDELLAHATPTPTQRPVPRPRSTDVKLPPYLGALLGHLDADDYQSWVDTGMGLKHEFGDAAFDTWDTWSATSVKYPGRAEVLAKWGSFQREHGNVATFETLQRRARERGWSGGEVFGVLPDPEPRQSRRKAGGLVTVCMADVEACEVEWLWQDRFPIGSLSLLSGAPGGAKSYFTHYMAACVSTGRSWCDSAPCERGSVLMISCEDDPASVMRPRLNACGADAKRVHVVEGVNKIDPRTNKKSVTVFTLDDLKEMDITLEQMSDARLVVIDPIGSYFGGKKDSHVDTQVRSLLMPLSLLARKHEVSMLIVAHTRKSAAGSADDTVLGSRAFTGVARAVHHMFRDPKNRERRMMLPGKMNLGVERPGIGFRLVGVPIPEPVFETDAVKMTADEMTAILARRGSSGQHRERSGVVEAWLRELLGVRRMGAGEIKDLARAAGLAWRTVQLAAHNLGVQPRRNGFADGGWFWELPVAQELDDLMG